MLVEPSQSTLGFNTAVQHYRAIRVRNRQAEFISVAVGDITGFLDHKDYWYCKRFSVCVGVSLLTHTGLPSV